MVGAIIYVVSMWIVMMWYIVYSLNYEERQQRILNKEINRFINNILTLDDKADVEYHLRKIKTIEEVKQMNERIERSIKLYESTW